MKAAQINDYGDPSVISLNEVDKPAPGEGQVLVEVRASSINPFDAKLRAGAMREMIPLQFPFTIGGDIAGVVVEVGSGVDAPAVGDKVYGQAAAVAGNSGAMAEFAATASGQVAMMPENLTFEEAASLPLVGVSAWQALVKHLNLQAGQKLFIHGGAGGIGSIAIQIARNIGARVATTATGDGIDHVKKLGADEVVDYKTRDFAAELSGYDAVFDLVGGDDFNKALGILKSGGSAVSMIAAADEARAAELGVTALTQNTHVTTEALTALKQLVENGTVTPQVDKIFPFDQIREAFEAKETGEVNGKIVIKIDQTN